MSLKPSDHGQEKPIPKWQLAGWTREPRNGYESKRLTAGKSQPDERDRRWKKPYRCKRHGTSTHKVVMINGRAARVCGTCVTAKHNRHYLKHKPRYRKSSRLHRKHVRTMELVWEDGVATVPGTWLHYNVSTALGHLEKGPIVIEVHGEPAYMLVTLAQGRRLLGTTGPAAQDRGRGDGTPGPAHARQGLDGQEDHRQRVHAGMA